MSPEINGNPPSAMKRKKHRDKKPTPNLDMSVSSCNHVLAESNSYNNLSIPDLSAYYSVLNNSNGTEPTSLPVYPTNQPMSQYLNYNYMHSSNPFGKTSTPTHHLCPPHINGDSADYLSLPVQPDLNIHITKKTYSDPGLPNDSDSSSSSLDGKFIHKLTHQVNILKESNKRLSKEVMDMRIELNLLKHQQNLRHFEREYEPGMLTDVIREVRDAARVREDALLARVKHIVEEKQSNLSHIHVVSEKNRNNDRISKLEDQIKNLTMASRPDASPKSKMVTKEVNSARQVIELEREALELRRELQDTRAKKEEADQKVMILDKKLSHILRRHDLSITDISDTCKTDSGDSASTTTNSSSISQGLPRVTLSGPFTEL